LHLSHDEFGPDIDHPRTSRVSDKSDFSRTGFNLLKNPRRIEQERHGSVENEEAPVPVLLLATELPREWNHSQGLDVSQSTHPIDTDNSMDSGMRQQYNTRVWTILSSPQGQAPCQFDTMVGHVLHNDHASAPRHIDS
jgi:hypothetical protein